MTLHKFNWIIMGDNGVDMNDKIKLTCVSLSVGFNVI